MGGVHGTADGVEFEGQRVRTAVGQSAEFPGLADLDDAIRETAARYDTLLVTSGNTRSGHVPT